MTNEAKAAVDALRKQLKYVGNDDGVPSFENDVRSFCKATVDALDALLAALPGSAEAGDVPDLEIALRSLVSATEDTLRSHPETGCCTVTRKRCEEARAVLASIPAPSPPAPTVLDGSGEQRAGKVEARQPVKPYKPIGGIPETLKRWKMFRTNDPALGVYSWERADAHALADAFWFLTEAESENQEIGDLRVVLESTREDVARNDAEIEQLKGELDHWRVKAECYGNMVHECSPALAKVGFPVDASSPDGAVGGIKRAVEALVAKFESDLARLRSKSVTCCFCDTPCDSLTALKEHSATCAEHPAVKESARLTAENGRLWSESCVCKYEDGHFTTLCGAHQREISEAVEKAHQWRSIIEKPPEGVLCLALRSDGDHRRFILSPGESWNPSHTWTHWMRIPPTPDAAPAAGGRWIGPQTYEFDVKPEPSPPLPYEAAEQRAHDAMIRDVLDLPEPIDMGKMTLVPENDPEGRPATRARTRDGIKATFISRQDGTPFWFWRDDEHREYVTFSNGFRYTHPHETDIVEILPTPA